MIFSGRDILMICRLHILCLIYTSLFHFFGTVLHVVLLFYPNSGMGVGYGYRSKSQIRGFRINRIPGH